MPDNGEAYVNVYDIVDVAINGEFTQRLLACYTLEALARIRMFGDKRFLEITKKLRSLTNIIDVSDSSGGIFLVTLLTGDNADLTVIGATEDWSETHREILAVEELAYLAVFLQVPRIQEVDYEIALREWLKWMMDVFDNNLIEPDSNLAKITESEFRDFIEQTERLIRTQKLDIELYANPMLRISSRELRQNWNFILGSFSPNKNNKAVDNNAKYNSDGSKKSNNRRNDRDYDDDYRQRDDRYDRDDRDRRRDYDDRKELPYDRDYDPRDRDRDYDRDRDRNPSRDNRGNNSYDSRGQNYNGDYRRNADGTWKNEDNYSPKDRRDNRQPQNRPQDNRQKNDVHVTSKIAPPKKLTLERESIFSRGLGSLFGGGKKDDKRR